MPDTRYLPPVDKLLTYGAIALTEPAWPDYVGELGLGPAQVPDLIRMATDHDLRFEEVPGDDIAFWGPVHAWRALGQLRALEAAAPLVVAFNDPDDEWAG